MGDKLQLGRLSPSDIARMVGMRPSAVSNWRRRANTGFPDPVATKDGRPLFDYDQVVEWLNRKKIKYKDIGLEQGMWTFLERWRDGADPVGAASAMLWAMCLRVVTDDYGLSSRWKNLLDEAGDEDDHQAIGNRLKPLIDYILEGAGCGEGSRHADEVIRMALTVPDEVRGCTFQQLHELLMYVDGVFMDCGTADFSQLSSAMLERGIAGLGRMRGESGMPGSRVSRLLADLAQSYWSARLPEESIPIVYDPACGIMESYLALLRKARDDGKWAPPVYCADTRKGTLEIAVRRLLVDGLSEGTDVTLPTASDGSVVRRANVFAGDPFPKVKADLIMEEPPIIDSRWKPDKRAKDDPRWKYYFPTFTQSGKPVVVDASVAWIQDAISHLSKRGRAFVVTSAGALFRIGAEEQFRRELLEAGCVEAIIALPANLYVTSVVPVYLWVLSAPDQSRTSVAVIDASGDAGLYRDEGEIPDYLVTPLREFCDKGIAVRMVPVEKVLSSRGRISLLPKDLLLRKSPEPMSLIEAYRSGEKAIRETRKEAVSALNELDQLSRDDGLFCGRLRDMSVMPLKKAAWIQIQQGAVPGSEREGLPDDVIRTSDVRDYDWIISGDRSSDGSSMGRIDGIATDEPMPDRIVTRPPISPEDVKYREITPRRGYVARPEVVTHPGDILLTVNGDVQVAIDRDGGHRVSRSVYVVHADWDRCYGDVVLEPEYFALMLRGRWNRELVAKSTGRRVSPKELEIPIVPRELQVQIVRYWRGVETLRRQTDLYRRQFDIITNRLRYGVDSDAPRSA